MTDNQDITAPPVTERLIAIFGSDTLALILEAYEMIRERTGGHGEIKIVLYDGKCVGVWETTKLKQLHSLDK
jgi:hypothetical protein